MLDRSLTDYRNGIHSGVDLFLIENCALKLKIWENDTISLEMDPKCLS